MVTGGSCGARPPSCSVVRVAPARRCGFAGAGPAAVALTASPFLLRGGAPPRPWGGGEPCLWLPCCGGCGGGGGWGGRPPARPGVCVGGGVGWGGPFGPLAMPLVGRGGGAGAAWQSWPRGPAIGQGVAPFSRPPLSRAGFSRRPSPGPLIPRPLSRGAGRPGVAMRVSGQWLAVCGAAGSPRARCLRTPSRGRWRALVRRAIPWGGRGSGDPAPAPNSPVPAVWAFTCAAACVGAGAAAVAGCAGGSASGRGRHAKPGGASCWRPYP